MFQAFNAGSSSFFSKSLIYRAMQVLQDETIPSADIPYMHVKTIEYLLRQKKCICGTHLDEGTVPYENVKALMDYLPPQSISTTVSQFKKDAKTRISALNRTNIPDAVSASYTFISDDDDTITDKEDELRRLESKMASSDDITVAVRKLETEIQQCKKSISTQTSTIARLTSEQDSLISTRDRAEKDRRELSLKDDKNRLIEVCRLYAGEIYNQLTSTYQASEKEVRDKLQATINSIFNDIYDGGLELSIDEKYHITVTVTGFGDDNVETSTAQSISVIFAFIAGIIKMARENKNASSENLRMLESEPYPLVMDAPLSAFDKKRILTLRQNYISSLWRMALSLISGIMCCLIKENISILVLKNVILFLEQKRIWHGLSEEKHIMIMVYVDSFHMVIPPILEMFISGLKSYSILMTSCKQTYQTSGKKTITHMRL